MRCFPLDRTPGYAGGVTYHDSGEMLVDGASQWISIPDMHERRTGFGLVYGPDRCVYAVGTSEYRYADGRRGPVLLLSWAGRREGVADALRVSC